MAAAPIDVAAATQAFNALEAAIKTTGDLAAAVTKVTTEMAEFKKNAASAKELAELRAQLDKTPGNHSQRPPAAGGDGRLKRTANAGRSDPSKPNRNHNMRNETRVLFNAYLHNLAELNGVDSVTQTFNVVPSVQQTMETKIQESSAFLTKINMIGVTEQQGRKAGLNLSGPIASRTDTKVKDREPRDLTTLDVNGYYCRHTDFDSFIPYAKLDAWAHFRTSRFASAIC